MLNEGDDSHPSIALGALERTHLVDSLYGSGPPTSTALPTIIALCFVFRLGARTSPPTGFLLLTGSVVTTSFVLLRFASEASLPTAAVLSLAALASIGPIVATRFGSEFLQAPRDVLILSSIQNPLLICADRC